MPWQTEMLKDGGCMRGFVKNNGPTIGVGGYDIDSTPPNAVNAK